MTPSKKYWTEKSHLECYAHEIHLSNLLCTLISDTSKYSVKT